MGSDAGEKLSIDLSEIRKEVDDARLLHAVLKEYCAYLGEQTKQLEHAFRREEHSEVRRIAHAIRGGAAILGAATLAELAFTVERNVADGRTSQLQGSVCAVVEAVKRACRDLTLLARGPAE